MLVYFFIALRISFLRRSLGVAFSSHQWILHSTCQTPPAPPPWLPELRQLLNPCSMLWSQRKQYRFPFGWKRHSHRWQPILVRIPTDGAKWLSASLGRQMMSLGGSVRTCVFQAWGWMLGRWKGREPESWYDSCVSGVVSNFRAHLRGFGDWCGNF